MTDTSVGPSAVPTLDYTTRGQSFSVGLGYGRTDHATISLTSVFRETFKGDCYAIQWSFTVTASCQDVIDAFRADMLGVGCETVVDGVSSRHVFLKSNRALVAINDSSGSSDPWESSKRNVTVSGWGDGPVLRTILARAKSYPKIANPRIKWNYLSEGKRQEAVVFSDEPRTAPDVFYPYLDGGIDGYVRGYMASDASILLLRGEPGTGKTSFIQRLIWTMNVDSMITYEERLFESDELFVAFITSEDTNLLIMEDADLMLLTRERHGNPTMAKFLNVADGLIRFPHKKIVISSNLVETDRIDPALLRPGRCFGAPVFRKLTYEEACAAADAAGRAPPAMRRDYALAEVLNGREQPRSSNVLGFIRK